MTKVDQNKSLLGGAKRFCAKMRVWLQMQHSPVSFQMLDLRTNLSFSQELPEQ